MAGFSMSGNDEGLERRKAQVMAHLDLRGPP